MDDFSYLSNAEPEALDHMYRQYLSDPQSVEDSWRKFFQGFEFAQRRYPEKPGVGGDMVTSNFVKEFRVIELIHAYRSRGHLFTETNPVRERRKYSPTLDIANFGLEESDLETEFQAGEEVGLGKTRLREIITHLQTVYCRSIGTEFVYMREPEKVEWIKSRLHRNSNVPQYSTDEKKHILKKLTQAVTFENFLHTRFPGQKRFSIEGGETLVPALDTCIEYGADLGIHDYVIGMAHRGRLNVLANIFNKPYRNIFSEFVAKDYEEDGFDGDVKYHLGYDKTLMTDAGHQVTLTLCPNPSHLEAVDPVVEGIARARIDGKYGGDLGKVMPILIHGDAAIAGQGVVYEVVQMAQLDGYKTGGTIHIVINNQVGFTTNYLDARSSTYCTDVGKVTLSPVFHVNGDDVESLVHTMRIAMEYRQTFHQDVFIDLLCYRKYGHNEGDEPKFTQPKLYKAIAKHPNPKEIYLERLLREKTIEREYADTLIEEFKDYLLQEFEESKKIKTATIRPFLQEEWKGMEYSRPGDFDQSPDTGVAKKKLKELGLKLTEVPADKKLFRKLVKILDDRKKMLEEDRLDWGMAELLAYATLVTEGTPVRFSGQDSERGTFSHRHAVVKVEDSEEEFTHVGQMANGQASFSIYNSPLSEYGVMGFEYGYALATPQGLTIWEAQFGDFFNGAQIMIDQFISSAEDKWKTMCGLVLLLPHGYEGMGAEHSSARMERFLTLCAEENMAVVNCTTPANFFHALRRQVKWKFRKPLVVFTPKSLLRHPQCVSPLEELAKGRFQEVIDDATADPDKVDQVVFCQGKLYYELLEKRESEKADNIAIVRMEQLYPTPVKQIAGVIKKYSKADKVQWVQEEPENMGALPFLYRALSDLPFTDFIGRDASASPASGSPKRDQIRQQRVIDRIFSAAQKTVEA